MLKSFAKETYLIILDSESVEIIGTYFNDVCIRI